MQNSYWQSTIQPWSAGQLNEDCEVDVVIIGGGLTGLLCAYRLLDSGMKIMVVEKNTFLDNMSTKNTGKVSAQQGALYHTLPFDVAKQAYQLNIQAIDWLEKMIQDEKIACHWQRTEAILFGQQKETEEILKLEQETYEALHIPYEVDPALHFQLGEGEALAMKNQAMMNPAELQLGLLTYLEKKVTLVERCCIVDIQDHQLRTEGNYHIQFRHCVMTTQFPIFESNRYYLARFQYEREPIAVFETTQPFVTQMINCIDSQSLSLRMAQQNGKTYLVLAGPATPILQFPNDPYPSLYKMASKLKTGECLARWTGQDLITKNHLPFIGKVKQDRYIATGYNKWGNTFAVIASDIITRQILNPASNGLEDYKATRLQDIFSFSTLQNTMTTAKAYFHDRFQSDSMTDQLKTGMVVLRNGRRYGVVIPQEGIEYLVDLTCPHMGCPLHYNPSDQTWDCPCHGSRFTLQGASLYSPSNADLQHYPGENQLHPNLK